MDIPVSTLAGACASALLAGSAALDDSRLAALAGQVLARRGPLDPDLLACPTDSTHGTCTAVPKRLTVQLHCHLGRAQDCWRLSMWWGLPAQAPLLPRLLTLTLCCCFAAV